MSIDYGIFNSANRDPETGIRYGIVSAHRLGVFALDDFEPVDFCSCPECGEEYEEEPENSKCKACGFESSVCEPECWYGDPLGWKYEDEDHILWLDEMNDVWVFKSPHTTSRWSHCSPCAPGAAYLTGDEDHGDDLAYCLGPEWYEED